MKTIVTIDFDIIMAPSIDLYNDKVPRINWDELLKDPFYQLLIMDVNHYNKIFNYLMKCVKTMPKENIHFIEDHGQVSRFIKEQVDLINIDHHHDLGYPNPEGDKEEEPTCANWGRYLYKNGLLHSYTWINNSNSLPPIENDKDLDFTIKDFRNIDIKTLPIPDELILCLSEPWVPYSYRGLFYLLIDFCNNYYNTHFDIIGGSYLDNPT